MGLDQFIEDKINHYAQMIVEHKDKADDLALGELNFYVTLRRVMTGNGSTQDKGMMDAVQDVLKHQGLVEGKAKFYEG